jgi:hypothetical protein
MMEPLRIGLAVNHSYTYYRSVLCGIAHYAETGPQWLFTAIVPEQQSLHALGRFRPAGLIASIHLHSLVQAFSSWRRPVVRAGRAMVTVYSGCYSGGSYDQIARAMGAVIHFVIRPWRLITGVNCHHCGCHTGW